MQALISKEPKAGDGEDAHPRLEVLVVATGSMWHLLPYAHFRAAQEDD